VSGHTRAPVAVPTTEAYVQALRALEPRLGESRRRMLTWHYGEPSRVTTATDMAEAMGYTSHHPANAQYGRLGQMVAEALGHGDVHIGVSTLVTMVWPQRVANAEWLWIMRPEVVRALEMLGWVERKPEYLHNREPSEADVQESV
jgi:hypothetical protein